MIYPTKVSGTGPYNAKIWIIGESPGEQEVDKGIPFIGASGDLLLSVLHECGISRDSIRLDNLCKYRPYANKFETLVGTPQLASGLEELRRDIIQNRDSINIIIALGQQPFHFLTGYAPGLLSRFRGSLNPCTIKGAEGIKVLGTHHPAFVLRSPTNYATFGVDIQRAIQQSTTKEFPKEEYEIVINPDGFHLIEAEEEIIESTSPVASDIESVKSSTNILCVGYAPSTKKAIVLSTDKPENLKVIANINASKCTKTFHFGTYDRIVQHLAGFPVSNVTHDTYIGQKVLNPQMPATLEFLTSTYTLMTYYKKSGRGEIPKDVKVWSTKSNKKDLYIYNGKDCIATALIQKEQEAELIERELMHIYNENMRQIPMAISMSLRGLLVDQERRQLFEKALMKEWSRKQNIINAIFSRDVNVRSAPTMRAILYEAMELPHRKKDNKLKFDDDTLVNLITYCNGKISSLTRDSSKKEWEIRRAVLQNLRDISGIRKLLSSYISIAISDDNRARSTFKVNGTETGRWAANKFVDDTGLNAQTIPREKLTIPDDVNEPLDWAKMLEELKKEEADNMELVEV